MPQDRRLRILIATVRVPFVEGGAELHAEGLRQALVDAGHQAAIVSVPFKWYPPERILDHMLACRLLDLTSAGGTPVDLLIGLKFPAYLIPHPRKVVWLLHQHRQAYDLWQHPLGDLQDSPRGNHVREAIRKADAELLPLARCLYANSRNVAARLKMYCGIEAAPLYHPPPDARNLNGGAAQDFLFFPSRLNPLKRQRLVIEALAHTRNKVRVRFSGPIIDDGYAQACMALARKTRVQGRVEWMGTTSVEAKRDLYARCLGVLFPPLDEDYGYVTLEAMLSHKPVITASDSGGPLEFVVHRETGLVSEPAPEALAAAMDELWEDRAGAQRWGDAGRQRYSDLRIDWNTVVERLLQ
ncbi:MAG: glycosyltransferase family 4 protein [Bryobacteraceae bacterium]|jgi:glycosyltransferase involved in cell wall biosynthesis